MSAENLSYSLWATYKPIVISLMVPLLEILFTSKLHAYTTHIQTQKQHGIDSFGLWKGINYNSLNPTEEIWLLDGVNREIQQI